MESTPVVHNRLTREAIDAFPIKSKDMTVQQLRQLCVEFFRFTKQSLWICDHDVEYIRNAAGSQDSMQEGQVYGGLPYIGLGTGNVYRTLDYMYGDGLVHISKVIGKKKFNKVYTTDLWRNFGNQCANGAYIGWGRVINSADYNGSPRMTVANGFLRVGPYTYPDDLEVFTKEYNTVAVCEENGEQRMFQSYAALQIGDGLNYFTTSGHVVMCSVAPHVVYNEDGTINGEESYLCITEQAQRWKEQENAQGDQYLMKPSVDARWTFAKLLKGAYLPFTFAEFLGTHPVEDTVCTFSHEKPVITLKELFHSKIKSNYGILDAYAIVTDREGNQVYKHAVRCLRSHCLELDFVKWAKEPEFHNNVDFWGLVPKPGVYHVELEVQLATGERPTVYSGTLQVDNALCNDPLTWEKINAFPIKYKGMPVAERRKLCADFFRFQKLVNWTPDVSLDYVKNPHGAPDTLYFGTVYRGFPYVTVGSGNVYRMMDFIDEKGYIDIKRAATPARKFGNQCAAGCFGGWGRVVNSARYTFTSSMTVANGFLRVGPYTYDDAQQEYGYGNPSTYDIIEANGEQVMFQSYAQMQLADGLVNYRTAGHVIMCTTPPVVVYKEDGTIDGEQSYLYITDQAQTWLPGFEENGDEYLYKNTIHSKHTFNHLAKSGYIPFTFPELTGEKDLDDTVVNVDLSGAEVTWQQVLSATVTANYGINDVYAVITDDHGKELYRHASRATLNNKRQVTITPNPEAGPGWCDTWGRLPDSGTYNLTVLVQLYTGERLTAYAGRACFG